MTFESMQSVDDPHRRHGRRIQRPRRGHQRDHPRAAATTSTPCLGLRQPLPSCRPAATTAPTCRKTSSRSTRPRCGPTQPTRHSVERRRAHHQARKLWYGATVRVRLTEASLVKGRPLGVAPYDIQHPAPPVRRPPGAACGWTTPRLSKQPAVGCRRTPTRPPVDNTADGNTRLGVAENRQKQGGRLRRRWAGNGWRSENLIPSLCRWACCELHRDRPAGPAAASVDFTGCDQFSPTNCAVRSQPPPPHEQRRRHRLVPGRPYAERQALPDADRSLGLRIRGNAAGPAHAEDGRAGAVRAAAPRVARPPAAASSPTSRPTGALLEEGLCDPATGVGCFRRVDVTELRTAKAQGYAVGLFAAGPLVDPAAVADRQPRPARRLTATPTTATAARSPTCSPWRRGWGSPPTSPRTAATSCSPTTAGTPNPCRSAGGRRGRHRGVAATATYRVGSSDDLGLQHHDRSRPAARAAS